MHPAKRKLALGLLVLVPFLGLTGCEDDETTGPTNTAPVINAITASSTTTTQTATVEIVADVTDEDGDTIRYRWSANMGTISMASAEGDTIEWTAPEEPGIATITLEVDDEVNISEDSIDIGVDTYVPAVQPYYVGATECATCHSGTHTNWEGTAHAMVTNTDGHCVTCHVVGYDETVDNGGWDEVQLDELVGIQCENCHGPGSDHIAGPSSSNITLSLDEDVCAPCHDQTGRNTFWTDWQSSRHGSGGTVSSPDGRGGSDRCSACHSGDGLVDKVNGDAQVSRTEWNEINCGTCHDPHVSGNEVQTRAQTEVVMRNGTTVTAEDAGLGLLCINCHDGRRDDIYVNYINDGGDSHWGPHHGPQGPMLYNEWTFMVDVNPGYSWALDGGHGNLEDSCVTCHMNGDDTQTGHSFRPTTAACEQCHGTITTFDDITGTGDYDGDGTIEGIQSEVHGLETALIDAILATGVDTTGYGIEAFGFPNDSTSWAGLDPSLTPLQIREAFWNLLVVEDDLSSGIHNPALTIQLLQQSILYVNGTLSGKELTGGF